MTAKTISALTADQLLKKMYRDGMKSRSDVIPLDDDTLYAVCLIKLAGAVERSDYPALKASIEGITGIREVSLLIDHQTRATVNLPEYHSQTMRILGDINLQDNTPEPE